MPQMAPMSWMALYLYFILVMLMTITKLYYTKNTKMTTTHTKILMNKNNWKW